MYYLILGFVIMIVFLYNFFHFSKDDYLFIRKSITMEQLFNIVFLNFFWALFFGRIFYVALYPDATFTQPLVFLLIPYFPGLSLMGMIVGMFLASWYITKRRKVNTARFLDYISIAWVATLPIGLLGTSLIQQPKGLFEWLYMPVIYGILYLIYTYILFPKFNRGRLKEGSMAFVFLISFAIVSLLHNVILLYTDNLLLKMDDVLHVILLCIASFLLARITIRRSTKSSL